MAVGHRVRNREFLQAAGAGCLDNTYVGDVVGRHGIEPDLELGTISTLDIMRTEDAISDGVLAGLVFTGQSLGIVNDRFSVKEIHSMLDHFYHNCVVLRILIS